MEEPISFDNTLESFFNQIANPFVEHEIVASQMYHLYKDAAAASNAIPQDTKDKQLKRPMPDESPSPTSGDETGHDQAAKQKNRRVNQNIASRNYRNRKKEYVTSLESKVSQLTSENEALKKEVTFLKRVDNFDSMRPDPSLISMVVELRHIMQAIAEAIKKNADDSAVTYLLQLFHLVVEKRNHIFEKEVEKLVNPFAQAKLAILGYTPVLEYPAVSSMISGPNTDGWWAQFMQEAKISPQQMQKLHSMREEIWKIDQELRQERVSLDSSIKEFYLHKMRVIPNYPAIQPDALEIIDPSKITTPGETPVEVSDAVELSRKLNALKKNFCTQRNLMINAFSRTGQLLSPKQQALLLLKLQIQTRFNSGNMDLLKNVWESVTSSEAPVSTLLSMIPGEKEGSPVPNTTTTFNTLPISSISPIPSSLSSLSSISNLSSLSSLSSIPPSLSQSPMLASVRSATGVLPLASATNPLSSSLSSFSSLSPPLSAPIQNLASAYAMTQQTHTSALAQAQQTHASPALTQAQQLLAQAQAHGKSYHNFSGH